jgi:protein-serine/threonine kinase
LARSASVREPAKVVTQNIPSAVGALSHQQANLARDEDTESATRRRNVNRHTIQPEYVEPQSHTTRGEVPPTASVKATRARGGSQGPVGAAIQLATRSKPLPQDPPVPNEATKVADYPTIPPSNSQQRMPPPTRPARDVPRSVSDSAGAFSVTTSKPTETQSRIARPSTGNAPATSASSRTDPRLPNRGSYGQPVAPTVEAANAHGRVTQPTNGRGYNISAPIPQHGPTQSINRVPVPVRNNETPPLPQPAPGKGHHRRSSTLSGLGERLFGRSGSFLGGKQQADGPRGKKERKYPPTSMKEPYPTENPPRTSVDSKRTYSFGIGKKKSVDLEAQQQAEEKPRRRSSILPSSFSFRGLTGGSKEEEENEPDSPAPQAGDFPQPPTSAATQGRPSMSQASRPSGQYPHDQNQPRTQTQSTGHDGQLDQPPPARTNFSRPPQPQPAPPPNDVYGGTGVYSGSGGALPSQSTAPQQYASPPTSTNQTRPLYPEGFNSSPDGGPRPPISQQNNNNNNNRQGRGVLQKNNRNFNNSYDFDQGPSRHEGSSGPARKVMDYFRRRKVRAEG